MSGMRFGCTLKRPPPTHTKKWLEKYSKMMEENLCVSLKRGEGYKKYKKKGIIILITKIFYFEKKRNYPSQLDDLL